MVHRRNRETLAQQQEQELDEQAQEDKRLKEQAERKTQANQLVAESVVRELANSAPIRSHER